MAFRFAGFADEARKSLAEQIDVTRAAGWDSIELRLVDGNNVCNFSDDEWKTVKDKMAAENITIAGFGSSIANWGRPITTDFQVDVDELKRCIPRMQDAGVKMIRIMSYPNDEKNPLSNDDWKAEVVRRIKELSKIAQDGGVVLGHENCNGYGGESPENMLELLSEVDNPALQMLFDTGNTTLHDDDREATWKYYQDLKGHISHVHIKAARQNEEGKWVTCFPDEDEVQTRILKDLKASGYEGWLSIEPHMAAAIHAGKDVDDPEKASQIYIDYAKKIVKLAEEA